MDLSVIVRPESGVVVVPVPRAEPMPMERGDRPVPTELRSAVTPEDAFDRLYAYAAPGLVHQTCLLTGRRALGFESVEYAFHRAWERWPEVAVDADPVGWLREQAYEYALHPWHRFRRVLRRPVAPPAEPVLRALLELPPVHRRTVLLHDGLGLSLAQTAAETQAGTLATRNRLDSARAELGRHVPVPADGDTPAERLAVLVADVCVATLPQARSVRTGSEQRVRTLTRVVFGATAALVGVVALTAVTTSAGHESVFPGGTRSLLGTAAHAP